MGEQVYEYSEPNDSCMSASEDEIEVLDPLLFEQSTFDHFGETNRTHFGQKYGTPRQYI